jgi:DNA repair exonuclease SbcCD ATPase subunit
MLYIQEDDGLNPSPGPSLVMHMMSHTIKKVKSMQISLRQAISKKDELTGKLKRFNDTIQVYNCAENHTHNIHDLYNKIKTGNEDLEQLKLLILAANKDGNMYEKIYKLRSLTTQRGNLAALKRKLHGSSPLMSEEEIDQEISQLENDIAVLKKELDAFNYQTHVEFNPKLEA